MKVGDLVVYVGNDADVEPIFGPGIVMSFDRDNDPVVFFLGDDGNSTDWGEGSGAPFYTYDIEVVSESR